MQHGRSGAAARIHDLIAPTVEALGLELFDVELAGAVLRVLVDRDGGVDLDTVGEATRAVSTVLDEHDPVPGRYTLEVSSPGVERPLRRPEHFRRAVGTAVTVKTNPDFEGDRRVDGTLVDADDEGIELELAGGDRRRLAYDDLERARTVFEWGPAPKPGGGQKRQKQTKTKKRAATS
jgi:ribosome maturation factor RimP